MEMHINQLLPEFPEEFLTASDLISINALVEQLALYKELQRETTHFLLETEFNVPSVKQIKRSDYNRAVKLLVDLQNISGIH